MSSGTREDRAIEITDEAARALWAVMDVHRPRRDGICPACLLRSPCHYRAEARAELILAGRLSEPRP